MEIQGALGSCIAETESKIHHDQWKKRNILFLQNVRQTLVAAGEEVQRHENEYIRKNLVSSAVGSMLKPINLRFSQVITFPFVSSRLLIYLLLLSVSCQLS